MTEPVSRPYTLPATSSTSVSTTWPNVEPPCGTHSRSPGTTLRSNVASALPAASRGESRGLPSGQVETSGDSGAMDYPDRPQVGDRVKHFEWPDIGEVIDTFYDNHDGMRMSRGMHVKFDYGVAWVSCDRVTIVKRKGE